MTELAEPQQVDAVLSSTVHILFEIVAAGARARVGGKWSWAPWGLKFFAPLDVNWNQADFADSAALAFPEEAADLVQLERAARDAKALSDEFAANPWAGEDAMSVAMGNRSQRDIDMMAKTNDVLNRFFESANRSAKLHPNIRKGLALHG